VESDVAAATMEHVERTETLAGDGTGGIRRGEPDGGGPGGGDDLAAVEEVDRPGGLTWGRVAMLGVALAFLGFAVGLFVRRDEPPAADSVDVGFLQDMLTHHEQALGVAALTVAYGEDPTVRSYAREVLTSQGYEQGRMSQMLFDWGYNRDDRSDESMAWMGMAVPVDEMPGLLDDGQMDQIRAARGAEMDALFLDLMAEHHRGGLHMAAGAAQAASDPDVRALAARMQRNQAGEINEYRHTAQEMGLDVDIPGADLPPEDLPDGS
jgi:uncharacterized protein (DUF305 family)